MPPLESQSDLVHCDRAATMTMEPHETETDKMAYLQTWSRQLCMHCRHEHTSSTDLSSLPPGWPIPLLPSFKWKLLITFAVSVSHLAYRISRSCSLISLARYERFPLR